MPPYSEERGGCVCNVAIELHAVATVRSRDPGITDRISSDADDALALAALRRSGLPDVHVDLQAEYPLGAGLGGSSAAGVAVLGALAAWRGKPVAAANLAEESRRLEVEDLHVAGGRQDHYAAAMGGALGLWFTDRVTTRRIALSSPTIDALQSRCVVVYTGQSRISSDTITAVVDSYRRRDPHVLGALDRMRDLANAMISALERADVDDLGHLVGEQWVHQRSLHPAIPTPAIDAILADALEAGALGGKALGASGGGCVLAIAAAGREDAVRQAMTRHARLVPVRIAQHGFEVVRRSEAEPAAAAGGVA